jgi:hypothetical protein
VKYTGEKPRFGNTEEKAHDDEAYRSLRESHRSRHQSPGDHDPGDPSPSAYLLEEEIARHLEKKIAEEKDAGPKAVVFGVEPQGFRHTTGRREAHVSAIDVSDQVDYDDKRQQPPRNPTDRPALDLACISSHPILPF